MKTFQILLTLLLFVAPAFAQNGLIHEFAPFGHGTPDTVCSAPLPVALRYRAFAKNHAVQVAIDGEPSVVSYDLQGSLFEPAEAAWFSLVDGPLDGLTVNGATASRKTVKYVRVCVLIDGEGTEVRVKYAGGI